MSDRKRVLIIEDYPDTRTVLAKLLRHANFDVVDYDCCEAAERHLTAGDIDIALLDVRLPGRCGDDYGKELRQRSPETMIVFITGEAAVEPLKDAVPDCFVLRKPIDPKVLRELLDCATSNASHGAPLKGMLDQRPA